MLKSPKMSRNRRNPPVFDVCLTVRRRRPILYSLRRVAMAIDIIKTVAFTATVFLFVVISCPENRRSQPYHITSRFNA